jgi:hypothetical protein
MKQSLLDVLYKRLAITNNFSNLTEHLKSVYSNEYFELLNSEPIQSIKSGYLALIHSSSRICPFQINEFREIRISQDLVTLEIKSVLYLADVYGSLDELRFNRRRHIIILTRTFLLP